MGDMDAIKKSKYFGYAVFALVALLALFVAVKIKAELKGYNRTIPANTISVSGEGKVFIKPDIATVTIGVSRDDKDFVIAQKEVTDSMNAIITFLKESGVEEEDQRTTSYVINPRYDYRNNSQKLLGYEVSHILEIKIRDLNKVGTILSGSASRAANRIGSLQFTVENPEKAKEQARADAIAEAKAKAKMLSKQLGVRLKKIVSFYESDGGFPGPVYLSEAGFGKGGDFAPVPSIPAGENEIKINVSVTYEIR